MRIKLLFDDIEKLGVDHYVHVMDSYIGTCGICKHEMFALNVPVVTREITYDLEDRVSSYLVQFLEPLRCTHCAHEHKFSAVYRPSEEQKIRHSNIQLVASGILN